MSLALGKNSSNTKQPLHLDNSNHLLVNDSTNNAVLETIATNTANINVNVGDVEINVADLEGLQATTNAKLIEISGKNTDIDNSVKANAVTVAKLNQILTKNTEIDTVLDACSAKLTDVDDSVKANAVTVAKLNQILTKNTEIDTVLDTCSAKLSDIDTTAAATATILRPYLIEGNATTVLIKSSLQSLDDIVQGEDASHNNAHKGVMSLAVRQDSQADFGADGDYCPMSIDANGDLRIKLDTVSTDHLNAIKTDAAALEVLQTATNSKLDDIIGHNDGVETLLTAIDGRVDGLETLQGAANTDLAAIEVLLTSANTDHAANEALLTTIDADTNNIKDSTAACATDLAAIEVLLTAANTDHAANEALLTTIDADTNNIKDSTAACATDLAAIEVLLTAANTDHAANEALLTTIDADTDAIKTSAAAMVTDLAALEVLHTATNQKLGDIESAVQLIDDAIKTEDLAHSSGDKGIPCLMVRQDSHSDLAADGDYMIPTINANGEIRVTSTAASGGSTEAKQDDMETTLDAILAKNTEIETTNNANQVLLGTIDADTDAIKTSAAAMVTDLAAIEVLVTAGNTDLAAIEVLLTSALSKGEAMETETIMSAVAIAAGANTNSSVYTKPRGIKDFAIAIVAATNGVYNAFTEYSVDNSTFFRGANINQTSQTTSTAAIGGAAVSAGYKYYRVNVVNNHGSPQNFTIKISY